MSDSRMLEVENLVVGYQGRALLPAFDWRVHENDFWALLGSNGSGKSTIAKTVLGLLDSVGGKISYRTQSVGFVPQRTSLDLSVPARAVDVIEAGAIAGWNFVNPFYRREVHARLEMVVEAKPDVFNHNLETVPKLYTAVRPGARYYHSLRLLDRVKQLDPSIFTKSGLMVGLGEEKPEVLQVMDDLRCADVDFLTIGQYLQPMLKHHPLNRFITPAEFDEYKSLATAKGFLLVSATPLTRSSYHADRDFVALREAREILLAKAKG